MYHESYDMCVYMINIYVYFRFLVHVTCYIGFLFHAKSHHLSIICCRWVLQDLELLQLFAQGVFRQSRGGLTVWADAPFWLPALVRGPRSESDPAVLAMKMESEKWSGVDPETSDGTLALIESAALKRIQNIAEITWTSEFLHKCMTWLWPVLFHSGTRMSYVASDSHSMRCGLYLAWVRHLDKRRPSFVPTFISWCSSIAA